MQYLMYILAGIGAGIVTGLAGLSAAVIITPILVSLCGWESYDAVTVALASDVFASLLSAYTYYKNKNIDMRRGGVVLMLMVFSLVLGYNLKIAVGTSTMVMSIVALVGAVSHISMGAEIHAVPMIIVMVSCLLSAWAAAKFANKCDIKRLNKIVGIVLTILGAVTMIIKLCT